MATQTKQGNRSGSMGKSARNDLGHLFGESTRKTGLDADWSRVDKDVLHSIIWAIDTLGGAVTFSTTKNNNAYCIKVFMGAPFDPMYFDGDDEGRAALAAWTERLVEEAARSA